MLNPLESKLDFIVTRGANATFMLIVSLVFCYFTFGNALMFGMINLFQDKQIATIVKVDRFDGRLNEYVHYSFTNEVINKRFNGEFLYVRQSSDPHMYVGDKVELAICRYFPSLHTPLDKLRKARPAFYIFIFFGSMSLILSLFLMWNAVAYSKYKRKMKSY